MTDRLTAIKARVEEATPGPWTSGRPIPGQPMFVVCECAGWFVYPATNEVTHGTAASDDADFIAHAREDLPWAVSRLEQLQEDLKTYGRHLPQCHHATDEVGELVNAYRILGPCDCGLQAALDRSKS